MYDEVEMSMEVPAPAATQSLDELPDHARIWIYPTDRELTASDQRMIIDGLRSFLETWESHGRRVDGAAAILHARFVVIAATKADGDMSGCGIDASVHALLPISEQLGFEFANPLDVHYRSGAGAIVSVDRLRFAEAVNRGLVDGSTIVYNPDLTTLGELRTSGLESTARESWHGRAFGLG